MARAYPGSGRQGPGNGTRAPLHKAEGADPGLGGGDRAPARRDVWDLEVCGREAQEGDPRLQVVEGRPDPASGRWLRRGQFRPPKGRSVAGALRRPGLDWAGKVPHLLPGLFLVWGCSPIFLGTGRRPEPSDKECPLPPRPRGKVLTLS